MSRGSQKSLGPASLGSQESWVNESLAWVLGEALGPLRVLGPLRGLGPLRVLVPKRLGSSVSLGVRGVLGPLSLGSQDFGS